MREHSMSVNRVPYTWDFGFLLLRKEPWEAAAKRTFRSDYRVPSTVTTDVGKDDQPADTGKGWMKVDKVWQALINPDGSTCPISWREFLHACAIVARVDANDAKVHPVRFDVDMLAPETFSCLILEMWASEIYKEDASVFVSERHQGRAQGLIELFERHKRELYRIWFLVGEVFSSARFGDDWASFEPRPAAADAVAVRHWYSTAWSAQREQAITDPLIPARLPGHYSVRGDWYLATIKGSRSARLGSYAIDILSSRRMNLVRLQQGLGLPTRYFTKEEVIDNVWTRLYTFENSNKDKSAADQNSRADEHKHALDTKRQMTYGDLKKLGATFHHKGLAAPQEHKAACFHWLWRSTLKGYDRQSRVFLKMLRRLLYTWQDCLQKDDKVLQFRNGFEAYDRFEELFDGNINPTSFIEFERECDDWLHSLEVCTPFEF